LFAETDVAKDILQKRYYAVGEYEPEQLIRRVAKDIAHAEETQDLRAEYEEKFYRLMMVGRFLPNSPCLVNAGRGGGLFACFVLGMEDDLESISKAKAAAMQITKAGGGWGIPLGNLRPEGSPVSGSTHGIAGGPVGFLETFSYDMRNMTQGGFRDAACMATLPIEHKDFYKFIHAKGPANSLSRMLNLGALFGTEDKGHVVAQSLLDVDVLRSAAETYLANFNLSVVITDDYMSNADDNKLATIATSAWENGEPGVLFIDAIRRRTRYEPTSIQATNPCGEQPLPPNGSCCLGHLNLSGYISRDEGIPVLDWEALAQDIRVAVRFLDNMITRNTFPTEEIKDWSIENRTIGLGIMGWADALVELGIPYDSEDALELAIYCARFIATETEVASEELGKEKGTVRGYHRRNRALLSIAPTGTVSLLANCSPGIEPPFSKTVTREDRTGTHIIKDRLADRDTFKTVMEIDPVWLIKHVAIWSEWLDGSVSYTVNLPQQATPEDVLGLLRTAWGLGCNGITFYRDKSRERQVLNTSVLPKTNEETTLAKRLPRLSGNTYKHSSDISGENVNIYVTVNSLDDVPWEVFMHTPYIKSMSELQLVTTATRLTSLLLRNNVSPVDVIRQLRRVEGQSLLSIPAILASALEAEIGGTGDPCPECGGVLLHVSGCDLCNECGYSTCG
jgi:ribonucleoside-diphosphate reductase alpha chain